jgi:hypothetical protein
VSFIDFNRLLVSRCHSTAFQLVPEAVDESWPNHLLSARRLPSDLAVSNLRRSLPGNCYVKEFSCWDQFHSLAFAQLTYRQSLRDIEACVCAQQPKLHHRGFRGPVSRYTSAHANEHRDWRVYADFAQILIATARDLYRDEPFGVELSETVYALESTTIDLCLALFPWGKFRRHKSAVKLHTLLDLRGRIPANVYVTGGHVHDVSIRDQLLPEAGAFYWLDRGCVDFACLYLFT